MKTSDLELEPSFNFHNLIKMPVILNIPYNLNTPTHNLTDGYLLFPLMMDSDTRFPVGLPFCRLVSDISNRCCCTADETERPSCPWVWYDSQSQWSCPEWLCEVLSTIGSDVIIVYLCLEIALVEQLVDNGYCKSSKPTISGDPNFPMTLRHCAVLKEKRYEYNNTKYAIAKCLYIIIRLVKVLQLQLIVSWATHRIHLHYMTKPMSYLYNVHWTLSIFTVQKGIQMTHCLCDWEKPS